MSEAKGLSVALRRYFSDPENGAFTDMMTATAGLTAAQAAAAPAQGFNNVWSVVKHVQFWEVWMANRLQGLPVDRQGLEEHKSWLPPGDVEDDDGWEAARQAGLATNQDLVALVASLGDEKMGQPVSPKRSETGYDVVQSIIVHNSYHIAEIISIRHMQGLWVANLV